MKNSVSFKNNNTYGIICIILSAFFFALMGLFSRLSGELPVFQKCFFRNFIALLFSFLYLVVKKEKILPKKNCYKYLLLRALFGTIGIICNFVAIDNLNLSDASILNKLSPFFLILFSYLFLKEKLTKIDIIALLVAFIGAIFIVKPSFSISSIYSYIGVLGGFTAGLAYFFLRELGIHGESGMKIVFWFSLFSTIIFIPLLIISYKSMSLTQVVYLCLTGLSATFAQFFITSAYTKSKAKDVSVFDYTQVIFSALMGFIVFNELPDVYSFIGYFLIISISVIKWKITLKRQNETI